MGSGRGTPGAGHLPPHHLSVVGASISIHTSGGFTSSPSGGAQSASASRPQEVRLAPAPIRPSAGTPADAAHRDADAGTSTAASAVLAGSANHRAARVLTPVPPSPAQSAGAATEMASVPSTFTVDDEAPFFERYEGGIVPNIIEGPGVFYMGTYCETRCLCHRQAQLVRLARGWPGICDILQAWGMEKRAEQFWKRCFKCQDRRGLSCVPPDEYHRRFAERVVAEIIEQDERVEAPRSPPTMQHHSHSYVLVRGGFASWRAILCSGLTSPHDPECDCAQPRENRSFAHLLTPFEGRSRSNQVDDPSGLSQVRAPATSPTRRCGCDADPPTSDPPTGVEKGASARRQLHVLWGDPAVMRWLKGTSINNIYFCWHFTFTGNCGKRGARLSLVQATPLQTPSQPSRCAPR